MITFNAIVLMALCYVVAVAWNRVADAHRQVDAEAYGQKLREKWRRDRAAEEQKAQREAAIRALPSRAVDALLLDCQRRPGYLDSLSPEAIAEYARRYG